MNNSSVLVAITGATQPQGKFEVASGKSVRVEIPETFAAEHITLATKDSEILGEMLKSYPREFGQIMNAVTAGKFAEAKEIGKNIGLTEDNFVRQGGGMMAIICLALACAFLLAHD